MFQTFLYIPWNPNPDFITVGTFSIKWYGVCWGLALLSVFFIGRYVFQKLNRNEEKLTIGIQYVFVCGVIGARLAHILFYQLDYFVAHPEDILAVWKGGLASHGGVAGAFLGMYLFCLRNKDFSFFWVIDHGVIFSLTLASLIRLGNLMNSEIVGKPADVPWAFIFLNSNEITDTLPRHPVVLYESLAYLLLQSFMIFIFNRVKESKPGIYLSVFLTVVFAVRLILEFFKEPEGSIFFNTLSKTQMLNLPFIVAGIILSYFVWKGKLRYK